MGDREGFDFKRLKRQLLRKHHVADNKAALRKEAQFMKYPPALIKHVNVHYLAVMDAVTTACRSADHREGPISFMLSSLRIGEVCGEEPHASLAGRFPSEDLAHSEEGKREACKYSPLAHPPCN